MLTKVELCNTLIDAHKSPEEELNAEETSKEGQCYVVLMEGVRGYYLDGYERNFTT